MQLFHLITSYLIAFKEIFYPRICPSCLDHLRNQEAIVCISCTINLPFTNFVKLDHNPLNKKFWGRIALTHIDSLLFMEKHSTAQSLLYLLKYHGRQEIGVFIAELVVKRYQDHELLTEIDIIVAVPLHPKKTKQRGYNQCHTFCKHLSKMWKVPFLPNALARTIHSRSQTENSRLDRWENIAQAFIVSNRKALANKHVLLVDDVLTTGATIEACGLEILQIENTKLSVLTMACKV